MISNLGTPTNFARIVAHRIDRCGRAIGVDVWRPEASRVYFEAAVGAAVDRGDLEAVCVIALGSSSEALNVEMLGVEARHSQEFDAGVTSTKNACGLRVQLRLRSEGAIARMAGPWYEVKDEDGYRSVAFTIWNSGALSAAETRTGRNG